MNFEKKKVKFNQIVGNHPWDKVSARKGNVHFARSKFKFLAYYLNTLIVTFKIEISNANFGCLGIKS